MTSRLDAPQTRTAQHEATVRTKTRPPIRYSACAAGSGEAPWTC